MSAPDDLDLGALEKLAEMEAVIAGDKPMPVRPHYVMQLIRRVREAEQAAKVSKLNEQAAQEAAAGLESALLESRENYAAAKDELGARTRGYEAALKDARATAASAMCWLADCRIASGDHGKRMLPEFVEYLRQLHADSEALKEDRETVGKLHLRLAGRANRYRKLAEELDTARVGAARYEKLRKLNAQQFQELYQRNIRGEGRFDDLVDGL